MISHTLPAFAIPEFPQIYTGDLIERLFASVDRVLDPPACVYESPESSYGACDGGQPCHAPATMHDLDTGLGRIRTEEQGGVNL